MRLFFVQQLSGYKFLMGNRIKAVMKGRGFTREKLAEAVSAHPVTISKLISGKMSLTQEWMDKISGAMGVAPAELLPSLPLTVPVVGYVGAGAEAHFYGDGQGPIGEVPAPDGATEDTVAVEVRGESLGAFFDRWLVFYDDVRRPATYDLVGKLCVVGLFDDRVLIKKLMRSREAGLFHLLSQTEAPILDVSIDWAAMVKQMVPR